MSAVTTFTSAARNPRSPSIRQNFFDVATRGRNTTVLRSLQPAASISSAIRPRYGSSAVPTSAAAKSPRVTRTPSRSSLSGTVCALMGQRCPSLIARGSVYSYAIDWKYAPRSRLSARSGVAVTPSTLASGK